ncbi:MAG: ribosome biogenesis GTPase Der [Myxococcales bacterium]|nr:ribosome biogenesis GTPase Der [Myxococcales bacterium]
MKTRKPLVAIVGRPNVGKSTLFNRLVGERRAIVEDTPGVTRDRQYAEADVLGREIRLIDTGGFDPLETEGMLPMMREQAKIAIAEADAILWLTSVRDDVTPADEEVGAVLRQTSKPVLCLVNKCDSDNLETEAMAFYSLGVEQVFPIAAEHNRGVLDVMEILIEALDEADAFTGRDEEEPEPMDPEELEALKQQRGGYVKHVRIAVVGRPNVGKSTLINALLGQERLLATNVPGTTRDSIDVDFKHEGKTYTLIDTAGLRRPARVTENVEQYSVSRTVRALERSHVAVLVLDATQSLADQDARIASLVERRGRACCVVVNKWDLVEKDGKTLQSYELDLAEQMPYLAHAPKLFISAKTGRRVHKVMELVDEAFEAFNTQIGTSRLNKWLEEVTAWRQPPVYRGKRLKLYFISQVSTRPPKMRIQVNSDKAVSAHYKRFLLAQLRETFDLYGTPIRLEVVKKQARRARTAYFDANDRPEMPTVYDLDKMSEDEIEGVDVQNADDLIMGDDWEQDDGEQWGDVLDGE